MLDRQAKLITQYNQIAIRPQQWITDSERLLVAQTTPSMVRGPTS